MEAEVPGLRPGWRRRPHPSRTPTDGALVETILARHAAAMAAGRATYVDPRTEFDVLTAQFLADRGSCCDSGCRHCPFVGSDLDEPAAGTGGGAER